MLPKRSAGARVFGRRVSLSLSLELYLFYPRSRPFLPIRNPLLVVDSPNTTISYFNPLAMKAAKYVFFET